MRTFNALQANGQISLYPSYTVVEEVLQLMKLKAGELTNGHVGLSVNISDSFVTHKGIIHKVSTDYIYLNASLDRSLPRIIRLDKRVMRNETTAVYVKGGDDNA